MFMRADGRQWASFMLLIIEVRGQEAGVRPISCGWASGGAAIFKQPLSFSPSVQTPETERIRIGSRPLGCGAGPGLRTLAARNRETDTTKGDTIRNRGSVMESPICHRIVKLRAVVRSNSCS